jgi:hypothetical protein
MEPEDNPLVCPVCTNEVGEEDDFCHECGELFAEGIMCEAHPTQNATGVCIVCAKPYCKECGGRVNGRFLCNAHRTTEIYEGLARVFGDSDAVQVEFAKTTLEEAGLHPFLFSRKASPLSMGGPDYTLFRASGEFDGHIINEFKLMVPVQEVVAAKEKLKELGFIQ